MNTENLIPISYVKKFTPLVIGDEITNIGRSSSILINEDSVRLINELGGDWFIVSFANRPNTTGKQPVDDDVVVDCITYNAVITRQIVNQAGTLVWNDECNTVIKSWKPNYESMLAKFKEQGANTMYTGKKAAEATHIIGLYFKKIIPGNMPEFLDNDGVWQLSSFSVKSALNHKSLTELSRPIGERKEDHTIDGILTKAQPQGAKSHEVALTIKALDDNPDEQAKEPESMIASSEFYQSNNPQVIEPYVADHLKGLINPVSEGCQAGDPPLTVEQHQEILDDLAENDKPVRIGSPIEPYEWTEKHDEQLKSALIRVEQLNKPVFTQEVELLIGGGKNVPEVYKAGRFVYHGSKYSIFVTEDGKEYSRKNSKIKTRPIDNRSDEQRAVDDLIEIMQSDEHSYSEIIGLIKAGKIHGVKWIIE